MAIGQLLQPMFETVDVKHAAFGGGEAEAAWRPMLVDAIGKQMAAHGGIGLAVPVFNAMLRAQEQRTMSKDLIDRRQPCWPTTLEAENAALAALDLPRAAGMLADKQRAVAELRRRADRAGRRSEAAERMARRLQALAIENKRLLERAIAAQGRVIGVVARAATAAPDRGLWLGARRQPTAVAFARPDAPRQRP